MDMRNNNHPLSAQTSSQRLYEDDHDEISRICRENGRKPAEEIRDLVSEALSARRNPQAGMNELMQTLQQLVEQNRLANERYERFLEEYERWDERNIKLKQGLIQNLREFYGIILETLSAAIGARRVAWNFVAHTVLKQSGLSEEQINERYRTEKNGWIEEKDRIAKLLEEGISKMPPQQ